MEQCEVKIEQLQAAIHAIGTQVAVMGGSMTRIEDSIKEAQNERARLWAEMRSSGNEIVKLGNDIKDLARIVSDIRPTVTSLRDERMQLSGAGKAISASSRALYVIGSIIAAAASAFITFMSTRGK